MSETVVYLDSSALAQRYMVEEGTRTLDGLYHRAESGDLQLAFSAWNLGEVLSAVARAQRQGRISLGGARQVARSLVSETTKAVSLGVLEVMPLRGDLLAEAVPLLFRHGLTQPDALQITSCRDVPTEIFLSADRRLLEAARAEGLQALHPVADTARVSEL
jgi:predicted nucleic acid-binding protein